MNLEPNNKSLSFAEFLDAAIRDKAETKPFPYTLEVCRCRYCSFCQNRKCALKRCCCMNVRVKARSCTFAELLRDCFANFKDNVFSSDFALLVKGQRNFISGHRRKRACIQKQNKACYLKQNFCRFFIVNFHKSY